MNYGDANYGFGYKQAESQEETLHMLAELVERATIDPLVVNTAHMLVMGVGTVGGARTKAHDWDELNTIFKAVKHGDTRVQPLRGGFKYIADPRFADYFSAPADSLRNCLKGACGGDCDDHASLLAALCGSIGFRCGLRAWGPKNAKGYSHVYALAAFPKRDPQKWVAMDTTVASSSLGWEPPRGHVLNAIFE